MWIAAHVNTLHVYVHKFGLKQGRTPKQRRGTGSLCLLWKTFGESSFKLIAVRLNLIIMFWREFRLDNYPRQWAPDEWRAIILSFYGHLFRGERNMGDNRWCGCIILFSGAAATDRDRRGRGDEIKGGCLTLRRSQWSGIYFFCLTHVYLQESLAETVSL